MGVLGLRHGTLRGSRCTARPPSFWFSCCPHCRWVGARQPLQRQGTGSLNHGRKMPGSQRKAAPEVAPPPSVLDAATEAGAEAAAPEAATSKTVEPECPEGMVPIEGDYCPEVEHTCLGYLDPPGRYHEYRCREYAPPRCAGPRQPMSFCIDAREYTPPGHRLPASLRHLPRCHPHLRAAGQTAVHRKRMELRL